MTENADVISTSTVSSTLQTEISIETSNETLTLSDVIDACQSVVMTRMTTMTTTVAVVTLNGIVTCCDVATMLKLLRLSGNR